MDVSADLEELAQTDVVVICAGAKAILDLPATVEYLETMGVPIVGYQTDEFPAFYSTSSGLPVNVRAETPDEIWTTLPPAKSMEPICASSPPPQTMCATG